MKTGYSDDKAAYLRRLRRIEGQVRGLERMVENDVYCIDVLTQISAATKALQAVSLGLLEQHLGHCVAQAITEGGEVAEAKLKEANEAIARLMLAQWQGSLTWWGFTAEGPLADHVEAELGRFLEAVKPSGSTA